MTVWVCSGGATYDADGNQTGPAPLTGSSYNNADQTVSLTPAGQGSLTASYTGDTQDTRLTLGGTTFTNGIGGLLSQNTYNSGTTYFERDPNGTLIGQRTGTTEHWYYLDGLGSVLGLIDSAGTIQATYSYDPYGVTTTSGPNTTLANNNPYRYASGYQDTATGLYKYGKRYYQPTLGRWTQQDTLDIIGDPANGNRYTYAGDDPINNIDPSGVSFLSTALKVGGTVAGLAAPFSGPASVPLTALSIGLDVGSTLADGGDATDAVQTATLDLLGTGVAGVAGRYISEGAGKLLDVGFTVNQAFT